MQKRLDEENMRALKIKQEREELMRSRFELRKQIDSDKQKILQDFDQLKRGKMNTEDIAKQYGYDPKV
jgi:hypothetical protein